MPGEKGKPVAIVGRYSGSDTSYKTVALWRIGQMWELDHGRLHRVDLSSSNYAKTRFRLTALGKVLFRDLELVASMPLEFPDNELPRGEEIKVECMSSDGTAISVVASITGSEY
jgi:hypothetical protein